MANRKHKKVEASEMRRLAIVRLINVLRNAEKRIADPARRIETVNLFNALSRVEEIVAERLSYKENIKAVADPESPPATETTLSDTENIKAIAEPESLPAAKTTLIDTENIKVIDAFFAVKEARHRETVEILNELLKKASFTEVCSLTRIENDFIYEIQNPHKNNESIKIYFQREVILCLVDSPNKRTFWHDHLDYIIENGKNAEETARDFFDNVTEILSDSLVFFEFLKDESVSVDGCRRPNEIERIYIKFNCGSNYNILKIHSWSGKYDKTIIKERKK
jgi:hypothetical protein